MFSNGYVVLALAGIFITGFSSILTGLNFIVTVHKMRTPGMTWFRLPLFVWAIYATSIILVLATPVLAMTTVLLVGVERLFRRRHLRPGLRRRSAAVPAPVLVLLASGRLHHGAAGDGRRQRDHRLLRAQAASSAIASMAYAILAIAVDRLPGLGSPHVRLAASRCTASLVFSLLSFMVAVPSAIKVFNWTATLYKGSIRFDAPMLYALGFVGLFTHRRPDGAVPRVAARSTCICTDTYFVVAHFHYIMVGGAVMAYLGGIHFWWPKITGRLYSRAAGRVSRPCWCSSASI